MVQRVESVDSIATFTEFLREVGQALLAATSGNTQAALERILADICERYAADRVVLRWMNAEATVASSEVGWSRRGPSDLDDLLLAGIPWSMQRVTNGLPVHFGHLDELPEEAADDRETYVSQGLRAIAVTPLLIEGRLEGALSVACFDERDWSDDCLAELAALANLLGSAYWGYRKSADLRESESRYRAILDNQTEYICRWLPDGTITWINDAYCHSIGVSPENIAEQEDLWFVPDDIRQSIIDGVATLTPERPAQSGEYEVCTLSGNPAWEEWTDTAIFDDSGNIIEVQSVGRDVTERRLALDALRDSESRFRAIVENTTDLIWESDLEMNSTYNNRQFEAPDLRKILHPEDFRQFQADIPGLVERREGWQRRLIRIVREDGAIDYYESTATPIIGENSEVCGFRGVDRDITGVIRAADEIENRDAAIHMLLDTVNDAIFMTDEESILDCNASALRLFGGTREMIIGKRPWEMSPEFQPDGQRSEDAGREYLKRALAGEPVRFDWVHARLDGTNVITDLSLTRFEFREGVRIVCIGHDITELSRANAKLSRTAEFEGRLAEISTNFLNVGPEKTDEVFEQSLEAIGSNYGFDRVNITWFDGAQAGFRQHISWASPLDPNAGASMRLRPHQTPWAAEFIVRGEAARIDDVTKLPAAAHVDKTSYLGLGYRAMLGLPLLMKGKVCGAFAVFCCSPRVWDKTTLDELQLIATTLSTAFVRQRSAAEIEDLKNQLQEENLYLRDEVRAAQGFDNIIGESRSLANVLSAVEQVAPTDVTVLVTGETGTGKELIAQSIHDISHRKNKPMVSVNCAALSIDLVESELFGHEKGAFTGAQERRKGRFELADGGTLFLDEIGEISGELQAKLLRVIQEGEFERLGGTRTLNTDVRLITATNRELQQAVDTGRFRADLFYRINSFPIHMPPLRERKEDIPELAEYFVRKHATQLGKEIEAISSRTLKQLQAYDWPGNIRELEGIITRALITTTGPVLDTSDIVPSTSKLALERRIEAKSTLSDAQRDLIVETLEQTGWVIEGDSGAAAALGLAPSSLRSKMKRLNIARPNAKPAEAHPLPMA